MTMTPRRRAIGPDEDCIQHGARFGCQIARGADGHSGTILDEHGAVRWRYGMRRNPRGRSLGNPLNKPDFVVTDAAAGNEVVIRRTSFCPSRFSIADDQGVRGTLRMASVLRNKYTIQVGGDPLRTFRMPLFTVRFWGGTEAAPEFWVIVGHSKMEWSILLRPGLESQPLLATLSFIHTEWWNYG
jgi:hypothetical protein